jgi:hypothetical protein
VVAFLGGIVFGKQQLPVFEHSAEHEHSEMERQNL